MQCLQMETDEERRLELDTSLRNEIVRDLVTQMFAFDPKPNSTFVVVVAKKLVRKYPFMKDVGAKVSGYVSPKQDRYVQHSPSNFTSMVFEH